MPLVSKPVIPEGKEFTEGKLSRAESRSKDDKPLKGRKDGRWSR